MADLPASTPRWADVDPSGTTEPSEGLKNTGWLAGNPRRQYDNWFKNLVYQWVIWLGQVVFNFLDFGPDQALPQGSAPVTGAGRVVGAASFSARAFVDGYGVGLVSGPAHTYAATSDTYWDLGRDGVWYASVVSSGSLAPALAAHRTRAFFVRTDASDRTFVHDYRVTYISATTPLDLQKIRHGDQRLDSAAHASEQREVTRYRVGASAYTSAHDYIDNTSAGPAQPGAHFYIREATNELIMVRGCTWNGTQWVSDAGSPTTYSMEPLNGDNKLTRVLAAATIGTPFNDSAWFQAMTASNGVFKSQAFDGQLTAGTNLTTPYEHSEVGAFLSVPQTGSGNPRELAADFHSLKIYAHGAVNNGIGGDGRGGAIVSNARYVSADNQWARVASGDAYAFVEDSGGMKLLRRSGGAASPWDDSTDDTNGWSIIAHVTSVFQPATVNPIQASASPPVKETLYRDNIPKAWCVFQADGSGGFAGHTFGCSVAVVANEFVITLANAMSDAIYPVQCTITEVLIGGVPMEAKPVIVDALTISISLRNFSGASLHANSASINGAIITINVYGQQL